MSASAFPQLDREAVYLTWIAAGTEVRDFEAVLLTLYRQRSAFSHLATSRNRSCGLLATNSIERRPEQFLMAI